MMIASITEFAESTAFERLVFDRLCPVFNNDESEVLDLRQAMAGTGPTVIDLSFTESLSAQAVESTTHNVMPLLFGATWKMGFTKRAKIVTSPILIKSAGCVDRAKNSWHAANVQLQEFCNVTLHRCKLDKQGCVSFALI